MSVYEAGKPLPSLLAEYVDGGPGCSRDDCMTRSAHPPAQAADDPTIIERGIRCLSCGKTWLDRTRDGVKVS